MNETSFTAGQITLVSICESVQNPGVKSHYFESALINGLSCTHLLDPWTWHAGFISLQASKLQKLHLTLYIYTFYSTISSQPVYCNFSPQYTAHRETKLYSCRTMVQHKNQKEQHKIEAQKGQNTLHWERKNTRITKQDETKFSAVDSYSTSLNGYIIMTDTVF